jgi:hypothetical protein
VDRKSTIEQTVAGFLGGSGVATGGAAVQGASNLSADSLPYSGDVLDQFVVDSPTKGQVAQSNVPTSYDEAGINGASDTMRSEIAPDKLTVAEELMMNQLEDQGAIDLNQLRDLDLTLFEMQSVANSAITKKMDADANMLQFVAEQEAIDNNGAISSELIDEIQTKLSPELAAEVIETASNAPYVDASGQSRMDIFLNNQAPSSLPPAQTEGIAPKIDTTSVGASSVARVPASGIEAVVAKSPDDIIAEQRAAQPPAAEVVSKAAAQPETPVVKARDVLSQYNKDIEAMAASPVRNKRLADAQVIKQIITDSTSYNPITKGDMVNLSDISRRLGAGSFMDPNASSPTKRGVDYRPKIADIQRSLQEAGILGPVDSNGNQELLAEVARAEGLASNNTAAIDKKMDADNAAPAPGTGSLDAAANTSLSAIPTRVVVGDSLDGYSAADVSGQPIGSSKPRDDLDIRGTTGGPFTNMQNEPVGSIDNAPYGEPVRRVINNPDGTTTIQVGSRVSAEGSAGSRDNYVSAAVTLPASATEEQKAAAYREAEANWRSNYEGATTSGDIDQNAGKVLPNEDIATFKAIDKKMDADNAATEVKLPVAEETAAVVTEKADGSAEVELSDGSTSKTVVEKDGDSKTIRKPGAAVTETGTGATVEFDQTAAEQVPVDQDVFAADQVEQEAAAIAAEQVVADAAATDTQTAPTVVVSQVTDDGEDEEVEVEVEDKVEDKVADTGGGVTVEVDGDDTFVPTITTTDEDGNTVTECPEGYTMVDGPDGPMCQKSVTTQRMRAGASTRPYTGLAGNIGRVGPGQRRKTTTTTQTIRA